MASHVLFFNFCINSLSPVRFGSNFQDNFCDWWLCFLLWNWQIALRWLPMNRTDTNLTLVQVMAGCHRIANHYLNQCWPNPCRYMASLGHNEFLHGDTSMQHCSYTKFTQHRFRWLLVAWWHQAITWTNQWFSLSSSSLKLEWNDRVPLEYFQQWPTWDMVNRCVLWLTCLRSRVCRSSLMWHE